MLSLFDDEKKVSLHRSRRRRPRRAFVALSPPPLSLFPDQRLDTPSFRTIVIYRVSLSHSLPFEKKQKLIKKLPAEEKAAVRSGLLPVLLRERDPRLSTALAMALASAASRDGVGGGPESDWPELLPALVSTVAKSSVVAHDENNDPAASSADENAVALSGAIQGLSLLIDEIDDSAALEATPHVLPAALRVVLSPNAPLGLRRRALAVGRALLGALAHVAAAGGGGVGSLGGGATPSSAAARAAADEALSAWVPAVAALLSTEDASVAAAAAAVAATVAGKGFGCNDGKNNDTTLKELVAFKMEALRFASLSLAAFSSRPAIKSQITAVAAGAWRVLLASSAAHAAAEVDNK